MSTSITKTSLRSELDAADKVPHTLYVVYNGVSDSYTFLTRTTRTDRFIELNNVGGALQEEVLAAYKERDEVTGSEREEVLAYLEGKDKGVAPSAPGQCCKSSGSGMVRQAHHDTAPSGLSANVPNAFYEIGERIRTQDNRMTADPLFVVFEKKRIHGMDPSYADATVWVHCDGDEASEEEAKTLEAKYQETATEPEDWTRTGYVDVDVFCTACFTLKGCEDYLLVNRHNLKDPHIYVETLYRNEEMIGVRNWLKALPEAIAVAKAAEEQGLGPVLGYFTRGPLKWWLTKVDGTMLIGFDISNHGKLQTMHMGVSSTDTLVLTAPLVFTTPPIERPESVSHLLTLSGRAMKIAAFDLAENLMKYARHLNGGLDVVPEIAGSGMQR